MTPEQENEYLKKQMFLLQGQMKHLFNAFVDHQNKVEGVTKSLRDSIPKPHEIQALVHKDNERERRAMQDLRDSTIKHMQEFNVVLDEPKELREI